MNFAEIEHCNIINANEECDLRLRKPNDKILWLNLCVFRNFVVCNGFDNCRCYFLSHLIIAACLSRRNKRRKHQLLDKTSVLYIWIKLPSDCRKDTTYLRQPCYMDKRHVLLFFFLLVEEMMLPMEGVGPTYSPRVMRCNLQFICNALCSRYSLQGNNYGGKTRAIYAGRARMTCWKFF